MLPPLSSLGASSAVARSDFWFTSEASLGVQHFRSDGRVFFPNHTHAEYNIVICLEGKIRVSQFGATETLLPGDLVWGNAGVVHASEYGVGNVPTRAISLTLTEKLFLHRLAESGLVRWRDRTRPALVGRQSSEMLLDMAVKISQQIEGRQPKDPFALELLANQLVMQTLRGWPRPDLATGAPTLTPQLPRWQFVKALEYMSSLRKERFSVPALARNIGSSPARLNRLFRQSTGSTPAFYFNRVLLERATSLLSGTDFPVKQIAFDLGFRTPSHFCESFRKLSGCSPMAFRAQGNSLLPATT